MLIGRSILFVSILLRGVSFRLSLWMIHTSINTVARLTWTARRYLSLHPLIQLDYYILLYPLLLLIDILCCLDTVLILTNENQPTNQPACVAEMTEPWKPKQHFAKKNLRSFTRHPLKDSTTQTHQQNCHQEGLFDVSNSDSGITHVKVTLYPQTLILELSWLPAIVAGSHLHLPVIVHGSSPTRAHCWKYGCYLSLSHLALNTIQLSWPNHYKLLRQYYFFSTKFQDFLWVLYPYHIGWAFCQL